MGIALNGYSPFGVADLTDGSGSRGGHKWPKSVGTPSLLDEPSLKKIAQNHNATPAQVLIAWSLAVGVPVNPRTDKSEHMRENLDAAFLELTPTDIAILGQMPESTCDIDPLWYECTPTATTCPPQCCSK